MNKGKLFNGFDYENVALHLPRNVFPMHPSHDTSCNLGEIKPVYLIETMPGATYDIKKIGCQTVIPSALKHPMLSEIYQDIHIFFVPFRIVWDKYKEFEGTPEPSGWQEAPQGNYSIPQISYSDAPCQSGDIGNLLGVPVGFTGTVSHLPFRAFTKIYNYFYRDENVETSHNTYFTTSTTLLRSTVFGGSPHFVNRVRDGALIPFTHDSGLSYSCDNINKNAMAAGGWCPHAYKLRDFFQTLLPAPQKGSPVTISLTGDAPVVADGSSIHPLGAELYLSSQNAGLGGYLNANNHGVVYQDEGLQGSDAQQMVTHTNLVASLSNVSVITIDALKTAISIQGVMHKLAHSGSRYDEWLLAIFGEKVPDFRIDQPECIGGFRRRLNIGTVLQSSETQGQTTPTGTMYGFSNTVFGKDKVGSFTVKERGYIIVCSVIRTDNKYTQGLNQLFTRKTRFDFAFPPLANLPDEAHYKNEIKWVSGNSDVLGFSERYGSYKFMESRLSGMVDPVASQSLSNWTAAEVFASQPSLNPVWKKSIGLYLDRTLVYPHFILDSNGVPTSLGPDQFLTSFYMEMNAILPLPIHPKPYRF